MASSGTAEAVTAELKSAPEVIPPVASIPAADSKEVETKPAVAASGQDATSTSAAFAEQKLKTNEVKIEPLPVASTSQSRGVNDVIQEAPSTKAAPVNQLQNNETVKVESLSTIIAGVVGDTQNAEVSVAKKTTLALGQDAPAPSLITTLEGDLQIVEKEVAKGVLETVATVEQHPELIAEGALAAVVGAASLVQPELLPGAVAIVGKMAMDNAKKTVTKIATDEGKKVASSIAKDISNDTAKEKAASDGLKRGTDSAEDEKPPGKDDSDVNSNPVGLSKDTTKATLHSEEKPTSASKVNSDGNDDHIVAIEVAQEPGKTASNSEEGKEKPETQPVALKITIGKDGEVKSVTQTTTEPKSLDALPAKDTLKKAEEPVAIFTDPKTNPISTSVKVEESAEEKPEEEVKPQAINAAPTSIDENPSKNEIVLESSSNTPGAAGALNGLNGPSPKEAPTIEEIKETPAPAPEQPSISQQEASISVIAAVASVKETATTNTTIQGPVANLEQQMVTISKESLDLLHQKIDSMHEAIKQITETLALHLPPSTSVINASKQIPSKVAPSEHTSEPGLISAPVETPTTPESSPATDSTETPVEPSSPAAEQSRPGRPSLEKRSSLLGSMGKIFWPFGSSSSTGTVVDQSMNSTTKSDTPKVPTITVSEVPPPPEVEI